MRDFLQNLGQVMSDYSRSAEGREMLDRAYGLSASEMQAANAQRAYYDQQRANEAEALRQKQVGGVLSGIGGGITPEMIQQAAMLDPALGLKLMEMMQKQQAAANEQALMQQALEGMGGGGTGGGAGAYILAESSNPMMAGIAKAKLAEIEQQRMLEREMRADERSIEKEERKKALEIEKEKRSPNQTQSNSYAFGTRMANAEKNLRPVEDTLASAKQSMLSDTWFGNYLVSDEYQKAMQAAQDWVTANLRKESGAAIPPEEMNQEIKKYFPVPGDRQEVIEQKRKSREAAYIGMRKAAGSLGDELEPLTSYGKDEDMTPIDVPNTLTPELLEAMTPEERALFE